MGVFLCVTSPAALMLVSHFLRIGNLGYSLTGYEDTSILGVVTLLLMIMIAVGIFIYSGYKTEKFKYLETDEFVLSTEAQVNIKQLYDLYAPKHIITVIIGVSLCILAPVVLIISNFISGYDTQFGVIVLLLMIAVAVLNFIYFGSINDSFCILLKINDYSKDKKEEKKVISAVAAVIWPLAVCIFLITGFFFQKWHINWIVFPITGILFGTFSTVYNILRDSHK